jgi:hypothetical protein
MSLSDSLSICVAVILSRGMLNRAGSIWAATNDSMGEDPSLWHPFAIALTKAIGVIAREAAAMDCAWMSLKVMLCASDVMAVFATY